MAVSLSIKNAPDDVVDRLRRRAARNHRSLQGELMSIITRAADDTMLAMTLDEIYAEARQGGFSSPDESAMMVREDRDRADGRR